MTKHLKPLALFACVAMLSACASAPEKPKSQEGQETYPFVRLAPSAPPMMRFEHRPEPTMPMKQVWRPGHWSYNGSSFEWVAGTYMLRADPTASWVPDRWEKHMYGYAFIPGHWK